MNDIFPSGAGQFPGEGLKIISRCPVCHYQYNPVEAKVLDENDGAHLIYVKCKRCQSAVLALVMTNHLGITSIGLITDLDSYEVMKFADLAVVNEDDVLSIYQLLADDENLAQLALG